MSVSDSRECPRLALLGGEPVVRSDWFPRDRAPAEPELIEVVSSVLSSGRLSMFTSGEVADFEREFAYYVGARHAVLVNSCTTALYSAMLALGCNANSTIAAPCYTYVGTAMPVACLGAGLQLLDVDPATPSRLLTESLSLESIGSVDALVQAHLFGHAGNFEEVAERCRRSGVAVIWDCAQFLGDREITGRLVELGPACFSFGESKLLRIGEGGMVATNDHEIAEKVRLARHEGEVWLRVGASRLEGSSMEPADALGGLSSEARGLNFRPTAVCAAIGRYKLAQLDTLAVRLRRSASLLWDGLRAEPGLELPQGKRTWWTYPVRLNSDHWRREAFLACLLAEGVPAGVHFPRLLSEHGALASAVRTTGPWPGAQAFASSHVVLPIYGTLEDEHVDAMVRAVKKVTSASAAERDAAHAKASAWLAEQTLDELCSGLFFFLQNHEVTRTAPPPAATAADETGSTKAVP